MQTAAPPAQAQTKTSRAMQMLEEGIAQITDSESFRRYLTFTQAFHSYSANNMMLIFLQAPDATMVAGYNRWKQLGRQVPKGAKAIKILAPIIRKVDDEETGERVRRVVGFKDCNVFSAEQTTGETPIPQPPRTGAVEGEEASARELYDLLVSICTSEGVEITERELGPGHYGYHDPLSGNIVLSSKLSTIRKATTLCHEFCHHLLHPLHESLTTDTGTKETEAEGASFAVCDHFGIDTSAFSFPYIACHAKEPAVLQGVLDRIQKTVHRILEYAESEAEPEAETVAESAAA